MTNQKYINHSYDAVLIISKYNEKTPEFNAVLDKVKNKNEVLRLKLETKEEKAWIKSYFELKSKE